MLRSTCLTLSAYFLPSIISPLPLLISLSPRIPWLSYYFYPSLLLRPFRSHPLPLIEIPCHLFLDISRASQPSFISYRARHYAEASLCLVVMAPSPTSDQLPHQSSKNKSPEYGDDHEHDAQPNSSTTRPPTKRARKAINCGPCRTSKLKCDKYV